MSQSLKLDIQKQMAYVTMARPEVRNAFDADLIELLTKTFKDLSAREDLLAIVLSGEGKSFCSGADLGYMKSMASFTLEENTADANSLHAMFETIRQCPHPIVARVQGHAMGGALGLIAVCDIATSVTGTLFCFSEVKLGLLPAVILPFVLERMMPSHARRYIITGEVFGDEQALASGLTHFTGSAGDVDQFVEKMLNTLRQNGPQAMRATKKLLSQFSTLEKPTTADLLVRRDITTRAIAERRVSAEGQEGLQSFLSKREPAWRPKK